MDFEGAAQRLARDQQKLRGRRTVTVSAKAKREADYRKKQQERIRQERQRQQKQTDYVQKYYTASERALGTKQLGSQGSALKLTPTSIWGEGDKIALPPSVLELLTQSGEDLTSSPWTFRIGIVQENYEFPSSPVLQTLKPPDDDEDEDDSEEEEDASNTREAYLDELNHKYHAYTHATVVEFTQDEGHVGLPAPIAKALLGGHKIPTTRTKDPSASKDKDAMQVEDDDDEKTPGHVAYGAFDVPDRKVEITMLKLPKGKHCTLTPTPKAIENGFYNLQNIKLVLEQSLIRTRATLSVGDTVQTWHRGVQFDLTVSELKPATFQAVTCINTDIEVEFGQVEGIVDSTTNGNDATTSNGRTLSPAPPSGGRTLSSSPPPPPGGRTLSSTPPPPPPAADTTSAATTAPTLLPEPPSDQTENICTVQIRANQSARRRFDVAKATMNDLFEFASTLTDVPVGQFKLVTRFPRRVFEKTAATMAEAGIPAGQEMIMVERI